MPSLFKPPSTAGSRLEPPGTASSTSTVMSHKEWKKSQKPNKFLQRRVVVDRFKEEEDPVVVAARKRREALLAPMHLKDEKFQAVLDACWIGSEDEINTAALSALTELRKQSQRGKGQRPRQGALRRRPAQSEGHEGFTLDDHTNSHGYSLLGQAIVDQNEGAVRFLVRAKAAVRHHDQNGACPVSTVGSCCPHRVLAPCSDSPWMSCCIQG